MTHLSSDEIRRYARHLIMPEVGMEGQKKLKAASVLLVGAGGLGSPTAMYLAAAGVGHIGIIDPDVVDESNLQRQVLHGQGMLGQKKVESAKKRLLDINPHIHIKPYDQKLTSQNALKLLAPYAIVADGTDNFPTRYLVNDACVLLKKPNVYASISRFEGQVSVFDARFGPCYRCLYAEPPPPGLVPSCAEGGVLGVLPGMLGVLQATEVIKNIVGLGEPLVGRLLLVDALTMRFRELKLSRDPACVLCGPNPSVTKLIDYQVFCGMPALEHAKEKFSMTWDITPRELAEALKTQKLKLVDVREPHEWDLCHLPNATLIPLGELPQRLGELNPEDDIVLYCKSGGRSMRALNLMRQAGFTKLRNLQGGINGWSRDVDPQVPQY